MGSLKPIRLGIDISDSTAKIVGLSDLKSQVVEVVDSVELGPDPATSLGAWVSARGLAQSPVIFSSPTDKASFHWTTLPNVRRRELASLARFKLRSVLPNEGADFSLGVAPIGPAGDEELEVMVIATPRELIQQRTQWLVAAGLDVIGCELEAQSLVRLAQREMASASAIDQTMATALVDIGNDFTRFVILQDQRIRFVRSIRFGLNRLVRYFSDSQNLSEVETHQLLKSNPLHVDAHQVLHVGLAPSQTSVTIEGPIGALTKELRRLLSYFKMIKTDQAQSKILERIILSGELVSIPGFVNHLDKPLGLRSFTLDPFRHMRLNLSDDDFANFHQGAQPFSVAAGLALAPYGSDIETTHKNNARRESDQKTA